MGQANHFHQSRLSSLHQRRLTQKGFTQKQLLRKFILPGRAKQRVFLSDLLRWVSEVKKRTVFFPLKGLLREHSLAI
jgi:hypothetical protein